MGPTSGNSTAVILETERLVLTPVAATDSVDAFPVFSDPEVMAHWDVEAIEDPDVVEQILSSQAQAVSDETGYFWAIRRAGDGQFLGLCDLSDLDRRHHRAEVGFILGRQNWGQGIAQEAMQAVLTFAAVNGLQRLWARTHVGNESSEKLLMKLGFELEGYLKGHIARDGERRDCRLWGLLL